MRPMTTKRRRSTQRLKAIREGLGERCQGECERCGFSLHINDDGSYLFEIHHRQRRSATGPKKAAALDSYANCTALHPGCHTISRKSVHQDVDESIKTGWLVPSWADPADTPLIYKGLPARLSDDGRVHPLAGAL